MRRWKVVGAALKSSYREGGEGRRCDEEQRSSSSKFQAFMNTGPPPQKGRDVIERGGGTSLTAGRT